MISFFQKKAPLGRNPRGLVIIPRNKGLFNYIRVVNAQIGGN